MLGDLATPSTRLHYRQLNSVPNLPPPKQKHQRQPHPPLIATSNKAEIRLRSLLYHSFNHHRRRYPATLLVRRTAIPSSLIRTTSLLRPFPWLFPRQTRTHRQRKPYPDDAEGHRQRPPPLSNTTPPPAHRRPQPMHRRPQPIRSERLEFPSPGPSPHSPRNPSRASPFST